MRKMRGILDSKMLSDSIEPIGLLVDGTPLYPLAGAEPEDDSDDEEDGDEQEDEDDDEGEKDDSKKDESKKEPPKRRKPGSKETPEQKVRRLNKENQVRRLALEEAERKLQEIEDKDKSELEIAKRDLGLATGKVAELENKTRDQSLELAFLRESVDKGYRWADSEYALAKLQKELEIGEDGTVEGMSEALMELAKSKPFLLKQDDDDEGTSRSTGTNPRRTRKKVKKDDSDLESRYGLDRMVNVN